MIVTITNKSIEVETREFKSLLEMCDLLNATDDEEIKDKILEVMPNDYDFIMNREKYGTLFCLGSPQVMECEWNFELKVNSYGTKLIITDFR